MGQARSAPAKKVQRRYNRLAPLYDLVEWPLEWLAFSSWRQEQWRRVGGGLVLEVGVGTGKNFSHYPSQARVVAIDLSPQMLQQAKERRHREGMAVDLLLMDAEHLALADGIFDAVAASFVFCSVADPVLGLAEVKRVCRPKGTIVLLEHVRSSHLLIGWLQDLLNPLMKFTFGDNINRDTVVRVRESVPEVAVTVMGPLVRLIEGRRGREDAP
ncbi:MAG: class I SAM-dependent methyltransferase [Chloroflexi bacterium]|nr:class I SAM-dependent methyltransferase [Chloroflexota bacterium]